MPRKPPVWQDLKIESFSGGLNTSARQELIDDSELLICNNVLVKQKKILRDSGYKFFGTNIRGVPQTDYQYFQRNGLSELLLITTLTVYKYVPAISQWQYIKGTAGTSTTATAPAGATSIAVASIAGFADNDYIGIILTDGTQHQTQVNGAPAGLTITFDNAIPVGKSVANGAAVVRAVELSGNLDNQVSIDLIASNDWLVFTNGVDTPRRYDGVDCVILPGLPAGLTSCKVLVGYNAALFMMNTIESGLSYPQRIRRTEIGDPTNWSTGLSGYDDLYDEAGFIVASASMGPYLVVYRDRSVVRGQYVNTAGRVYQFDTLINGEGAVSGQAVVDLNSEHLLFGNAGIYSFTGGYDLNSVDDNVFYSLFSSEGDLNTSFKHRVFSFYVEELDEAWFFYPSTGSEYPNTLLRYNVSDKTWAKRIFSHTFIGFGFYQSIASHRWSDLVGSWNAQTWKWNSRSVSGDSPTTHLMSPEVTKVLEYDYLTSDDAGVPIVSVIETKDYFNGDVSMRHDMFQFYAAGTDIFVEYSIDSGDSFTTLGITSSNKVSIHTLNKQFICDKIRYRITCSAQNFELRWARITYRDEADTMHRSAL